jgi:glycosyltransferase involved in cell wall biosynthesis
MRIAMVSEHASPLAPLQGVDAGGQNVHVAALADYLSRQGNHVDVYTRRDAPDLAPRQPVGDNVTVWHLPAGPPRSIPKDDLLQYMDAFSQFLLERWVQSPPDVVHSHFWMSGLASLKAALPLGIPVVHTYHALGTVKRRYQGVNDTSPEGRVETETWIGESVDRIIATCSDEVLELGRMGISDEKIWVIPCGVDLELFGPDGDVFARGDRPRLLAAGRLVERKGFGDLIEALADIDDAELVIAGGPEHGTLDDDPEVQRLLEVAQRANVSDRLRMIGSVSRDAMPAVIRSADVVVCVPWYEPFGIVPLEAMACGVPVVAAATGGMTDSVAHMETGLHVTPRSPDETAAAVNRLLANDLLRARFSTDSVRRARERFDWRQIAESTRRVYEELVAHRAIESVERSAW